MFFKFSIFNLHYSFLGDEPEDNASVGGAHRGSACAGACSPAGSSAARAAAAARRNSVAPAAKSGLSTPGPSVVIVQSLSSNASLDVENMLRLSWWPFDSDLHRCVRCVVRMRPDSFARRSSASLLRHRAVRAPAAWCALCRPATPAHLSLSWS